MKIFAYLANQKGEPCPVLFHNIPTDGHNKSQIKDVLFSKELDQTDHSLSLDQLITKYPYSGDK